MTITIEVHAIFLIFYSSKQEESPDSITKGQKSPMFKYIYKRVLCFGFSFAFS